MPLPNLFFDIKLSEKLDFVLLLYNRYKFRWCLFNKFESVYCIFLIDILVSLCWMQCFSLVHSILVYHTTLY